MSPELELQGVLVAALKADPDVAALVGARVYDTVPRDTDFPYISLGPMEARTDDAECITGFMIFSQIDVWSQAVGYPEVKRLIDAVRHAIHDQDLSLTVNALVFIEHQTSRILRDPDGLTSHGALDFVASVERMEP